MPYSHPFVRHIHDPVASGVLGYKLWGGYKFERCQGASPRISSHPPYNNTCAHEGDDHHDTYGHGWGSGWLVGGMNYECVAHGAAGSTGMDICSRSDFHMQDMQEGGCRFHAESEEECLAQFGAYGAATRFAYGDGIGFFGLNFTASIDAEGKLSALLPRLILSPTHRILSTRKTTATLHIQ